MGTKLKLAFTQDKHDTIGIDCVAMCVNDIACHGARPLIFLDYIATSKVKPDQIAQIVKGVANGCMQCGAALIGGETAEMPDFYAAGEYDIAGFAVGSVVRNKMIIGSEKVKTGDVLIGLASSGLHSNGFSLVRKLVGMDKLHMSVEQLGCTIGEELLRPTRIYVSTILTLNDEFDLHGIAHITGGGFYENIPRIFAKGQRARIKIGSWPILPIFDVLKTLGDLSMEEMFNTFNMGIGMVIAVSSHIADALIQRANQLGEKAYIIGKVIDGDPGVDLCR